MVCTEGEFGFHRCITGINLLAFSAGLRIDVRDCCSFKRANQRIKFSVRRSSFCVTVNSVGGHKSENRVGVVVNFLYGPAHIAKYDADDG